MSGIIRFVECFTQVIGNKRFIKSVHERKVRKMLNNFFTFVLKSCAFTANPKEITVNDVASTFDTADQGCKFFGNLIFREIS